MGILEKYIKELQKKWCIVAIPNKKWVTIENTSDFMYSKNGRLGIITDNKWEIVLSVNVEWHIFPIVIKDKWVTISDMLAVVSKNVIYVRDIKDLIFGKIDKIILDEYNKVWKKNNLKTINQKYYRTIESV